MVRLRKMRVVLITLALAASVVAQTAKTPNSNEETGYCGDEQFAKPARIPTVVLQKLLRSPEFKLNAAFANEEERARPERMFQAAEVHLGGPDEIDLIVKGTSAATMGADNDWFWIVQSAYKNPKIVLWEGTYCLYVSSKRTNGLRDISSTWSSASETRNVTFHFDGMKYKPGKVKWTENRR